MKKKLTDYQKQWKARRTHILKEPFFIADAPDHKKNGVYMIGKKDLQEIVVDLCFKEKDLEQYDTLNSNICFLKDQCKTKANCQQLYEWLGLEMRFLVALDAIAQYQSRPIDPVAPAGGASAATPSTPGDKNDDADKPSDDEPAAGGGAPPRRQDPHHFLNWDVADSLFSIPWNEMGFADVQDSADLYSFWPACILFFYVPDLPKKFPKVDNALHKLWQQTYKSAMKAEDLDSTPITFTDEEAEWCKKSIESLQRLLTDAQREERGLPTGLRRGTARTKKSAQDKAAAAAAAGQGAQDSVRRRAAAETSDDSDVAPGLKVPRG